MRDGRKKERGRKEGREGAREGERGEERGRDLRKKDMGIRRINSINYKETIRQWHSSDPRRP